MPRLSSDTRAKRRDHILTSAWICFSRNGFHATSMDDVIAATGMSSSAVYRYFRSKEELINASVDVGIGSISEVFSDLLATRPTPSPACTLAVIVEQLHRRTDNEEYDLTRLAIQTWAEAVRQGPMREYAQSGYRAIRAQIVELAQRWRVEGQVAADADPDAVASVLSALMHGLIADRHLVADVPLDSLTGGLAALGAALR